MPIFRQARELIMPIFRQARELYNADLPASPRSVCLQDRHKSISFARFAATHPKNDSRGPGDLVLERLLRAAVNTWNGLIAAARSEQAFREEIAVLAIGSPLAFFIGTETWKPLTLIAVLLMVMVVELLNTAVEKLSDFVTPAHDERIGRIKDMGSAAVGLAIIAAALIWLQAIAVRFAWW
jgi:diacylglycerol kinase (ATP)